MQQAGLMTRTYRGRKNRRVVMGLEVVFIKDNLPLAVKLGG